MLYIVPKDLYRGRIKAGEVVEPTPAYDEQGSYTLPKGHSERFRIVLPAEIVEMWEVLQPENVQALC